MSFWNFSCYRWIYQFIVFAWSLYTVFCATKVFDTGVELMHDVIYRCCTRLHKTFFHDSQCIGLGCRTCKMCLIFLFSLLEDDCWFVVITWMVSLHFSSQKHIETYIAQSKCGLGEKAGGEVVRSWGRGDAGMQKAFSWRNI